MEKGRTEKEPRFGSVNFERRKHPRLSVDLPVEYWQINNPKCHPGGTADISEGGLLLYISEEIEIGQNLRVKLFFDSGLKLRTIESQVQVVWKDFQRGKEGYYRIGVKLIDISLEDMEKLRSLLNNLMNSKIRTDCNVPARLLSTLGISILGDYAYLPPKAPNQD
jgi:c-di-GMP-binding flagellar brake protein YcgR